MRAARILLCFTLFSNAVIVAQQPAATAPLHYVEKEIAIPVPGASPQGLDALEVYAERPGRHPLIVLTHGTSPDKDIRMHLTPWGQLSQALWFAERGYVAIMVIRKGYGRSGGRPDTINSGCSSNGSFEDAGYASVDDLKAVMKFAQTLPEVDGTTMLSAGVSTGGFAQAVLSANPPAGLKAALDFAGGRGGDDHEHECNMPGILDAFESYGKQAHKHGSLPMLWIYSQNDHFFPPSMAVQFRAAYEKGGGTDQFVMAPPDGDDGHHLYSHVDVWSATVQEFLKAHDLLPLGDTVLPAPQTPNIPAPATLRESGVAGWQRYLLGGPFKAFATNGRTGWGLATGAFDQQLADSEALDHCKKANGACTVVSKTSDLPR